MKQLPFILAILVALALFVGVVLSCPGVNAVAGKVRADMLSSGPGPWTTVVPTWELYTMMGEGIECGKPRDVVALPGNASLSEYLSCPVTIAQPMSPTEWWQRFVLME